MAGDDSTPDPPPAETPKTVIAALGPKMLALAGSHTDGAHPYLVSPAHTQEARRILGPGKLLCPEQTVLADTDPARARRIGRAWLGRYLEMANYRDNLLRLGFAAPDIANGGSEATPALPDERLLATLAPKGQPSRVRLSDRQTAAIKWLAAQPDGPAKNPGDLGGLVVGLPARPARAGEAPRAGPGWPGVSGRSHGRRSPSPPRGGPSRGPGQASRGRRGEPGPGRTPAAPAEVASIVPIRLDRDVVILDTNFDLGADAPRLARALLATAATFSSWPIVSPSRSSPRWRPWAA